MTPLVGKGRQFTLGFAVEARRRFAGPRDGRGSAPALAAAPSTARQFFARARRPGVMNLTGILGSTPVARL